MENSLRYEQRSLEFSISAIVFVGNDFNSSTCFSHLSFLSTITSEFSLSSKQFCCLLFTTSSDNLFQSKKFAMIICYPKE